MDLILSFLPSIVGALAAVPVVGKVLAVVISGASILIIVVNALVVVWHAIVGLLQAVAKIPGLSGVQSLADTLRADSDVIDGVVSGKIIPLLDRISSLPLPQVAAQPSQPQI